MGLFAPQTGAKHREGILSRKHAETPECAILPTTGVSACRGTGAERKRRWRKCWKRFREAARRQSSSRSAAGGQGGAQIGGFGGLLRARTREKQPLQVDTRQTSRNQAELRQQKQPPAPPWAAIPANLREFEGGDWGRAPTSGMTWLSPCIACR